MLNPITYTEKIVQSFLKYQSTKKSTDGTEWHHEQIELIPLNPDFDPIILTPEQAGEVRVIAELIAIAQLPTIPNLLTTHAITAPRTGFDD